MKSIAEIELTGTNALKKLRKQKLQNGFPFMINARNLPSNQCYFEYPNGTITLVELIKGTRDFIVVKQCGPEEISFIRMAYNLPG